MEEHAYFSPSASSRWIPCPMSLYLSEQKEESKTSKFAHEGTICHEIAATCLTKHGDPSDFQGKIIQGVAITPELVSGMQLYVDEIRGLAKEHQANGGKIEHQVKITNECWGTVDALLWNNDTALICDLKMGKGIVVDVENNNQLKLYSIGALRWLRENHKIRPTKVINIIIQPRTPDPIRVTEISYEELLNWYDSEVVEILQTHDKGKPSPKPCNPGVIQCRWCPVSATCAAQANKVVNDTQRAFQPFTKVTAPKITKTEWELSLLEMIEYKKTFAHIQQWIKGIDSYIMEAALAGESIPGFKLVEGRSIRIWKVTEKEVETFLRGLNVEPFTKKLLSPPQAEKTIGKKRAKKVDLDALIIKPEGKPTLALEGDKRPALSQTTDQQVEEAFSETPSKPVKPKAILEVLLVDEKETEDNQMSVLKRMQMAAFEDEDEIVEKSETITQIIVETATSGTPKCILEVNSAKQGVPPDMKTKRYQVLQFGKKKGGATLAEVSNILGCKENMVKMHLRYLNERDGYSYKLFNDDTFIVE